MAYFATEYTIHFDDTMAYGSHHFLTAFKFQCAARESFLFGERIFDLAGVRESLDQIHLITADAYARNLSPARLGDRVAILLTLEDWGRASARFCYRVIADDGRPVSAGFQTLICADPLTNAPVPLPPPLFEAMEAMREIEEPAGRESFRERVLAGGAKTDALIGIVERETALQFLAERYPEPRVIEPVEIREPVVDQDLARESSAVQSAQAYLPEAWVFAGQGTFDPELLVHRMQLYQTGSPRGKQDLQQVVAIASERLDCDAQALLNGSVNDVRAAMKAAPALLQVGIHLQNVLGGLLRRSAGHTPTVVMGHSFGEIAALGAAGCFDLITGIRIVCERVRAIEQHLPPEGGLMAASTTRHVISEESAVLGLKHLRIAGRNHAHQTVISGPRPQLEQLRVRLKSRGIQAVPIVGSTSFHHPQLGDAAASWLTQLRNFDYAPPTVPVYSAIGRRFILPDEDIAEVLASQLLRPFDLAGAIRDVAKLGVRQFVDCGSSGVLSRILSQACPPEAKVIRSDDPAKVHTANVAEATASKSPTTSNSGGDNYLSLHATDESSVSTTAAARNLERSGERETPTIAIIGEGCLLPGGASTPAKLYEAIEEQRSGIIDQRDIDPEWATDFYSEKLAPDRSTSPLMGRVRDEDLAPPAGVDPEVFHSFSRTQKLLCIALAPCIDALRKSERPLCIVGATADGFEDQDVAVSLEYAGISARDDEVDRRLHTARAAGMTPHRAIQEVFDRLVQPGLEVWMLDAACASSLYAAALGMHALESGEADVVVAGGVFCPGPGNSCLFSQFRGLTSTGLRPFDANADGVVFSEGAAFVALSRTSRAEELGLPISAVVRGAGLSSDGRSSSANVPQTRGQLLSLERCYQSYDIDPSTICAIEAHGTSTPVGDSTEVDTLRQFFERHATSPIPIHSLKGLLGHAGWAAGTASIVAVCEYLRRSQFPGQSGHRQPSPALQAAADTLQILSEPQRLPDKDCRIAIDGFGFGGANAHLVLEQPAPSGVEGHSQRAIPQLAEESTDGELVVVARHELTPTEAGVLHRDVTKWLEGHLVLPDLADDMDITQAVTSALVAGVMNQVESAAPGIRSKTAIVLGLAGKTERGIEATARVLSPRLRRLLADSRPHAERLDQAARRARPSGPYTLQCMMPNVSAGRAALLANTNGPNFVVDAGLNSVEAAVRSAKLLLSRGSEGGTEFVVTAFVQANQYATGQSTYPRPQREYAVALGVTTRRFARQHGLDVLGSLQDVEPLAGLPEETPPPAAKSSPPSSPAADQRLSEFPIHTPVWIDSAAEESEPVAPQGRWLVLTRDDSTVVAELLRVLPRRARAFAVGVVGEKAENVVRDCADPRLLAFDPANEFGNGLYERLEDLQPDAIVSLEVATSWHADDALRRTAEDNRLCEAMFTAAQHESARLATGELELWGLCWNGWNDAVHPASGPLAGMLKAVQREYPQSRCGTICSRSLTIDDLFARILSERSQRRHETEVVYDGQRRLVRRLQPVAPHGDHHQSVTLDRHSVVLATGGARGVTAVLLESLLRECGCTVVAIGRSPLERGPSGASDSEIEREFYERRFREQPATTVVEMKKDLERARAKWEAYDTIERLANLGGQIEYRVADVTNPEQIAQVMAHIHEKHGRLDLVLHGAGVQFSKRLEKRTLSEFRRTFDVKVKGLRNLVDQARRLFGEHVAVQVLTSAYSVFGNDGQHDYGAANETMDRYCELSARQGHSCTSIAWLAWDGIGMTRGSEYRALAEQRNLSGLQAADGQEIFREVLAGNTGAAINVPLSSAEHQRYEVKTIPTASSKTERAVEVELDLSTLPELQHHRVRNTPTLPGAWILERMVQAATRLLPPDSRPTTVTVSDITFKRFVRFEEGVSTPMRIVARDAHDGMPAWVIGDVCHSSGVTLLNDEVFASATIAFNSERLPEQATLTEFSGCWRGDRPRLADPYCRGGRQDVQLSGCFDRLRDIEIQPGGRRATFQGDTSCPGSRTIPALLLDAAWRLGAMYAEPDSELLYVPVRVAKVTMPLGRPTSEEIEAGYDIRSAAPRVDGSKVFWDRTEVLRSDGTVAMIVEGCQAKRLG